MTLGKIVNRIEISRALNCAYKISNRYIEREPIRIIDFKCLMSYKAKYNSVIDM